MKKVEVIARGMINGTPLLNHQMRVMIKNVRNGNNGFEEIENDLQEYIKKKTAKLGNRDFDRFRAKYVEIKGQPDEDVDFQAMTEDYVVCKNLFNVKIGPYIKRNVFKMDFEDKIAFISGSGKIMKAKEVKAVKKIAASQEMSNLETVNKYKRRIKNLGINFQQFYAKNMQYMIESKQERAVRNLNTNTEQTELRIEELCSIHGVTREQIEERVKQINADNPTYKITIDSYYTLELDTKTDEEISQTLAKVREAKNLGRKLRIILDDVRNGDKELSVAEEKLNRLYELCSVFATQRVQDALKAMYSEEEQERLSPEELYNRTVDSEVSKRAIGANLKEYVAFGFADKNIEERLKYISDNEKNRMLAHMTTAEAMDILNDKFKSYELLSKWYGREMIQVTGKDDYETFKKFFESHTSFVKKESAGSMGRSVELVYTEGEKCDKLFEQYISVTGGVILEELVKGHPSISQFNPDSVNTVRMVTYYEDGKVYYPSVTMRIGMKGSFVDNAGAGGISVRIDHETGKIASDGYRQNGMTVEAHPETGIVFKGFQIPNWDKARQVGKEIANIVPGATYVGWDIALNESGEWVIIEGNATPQLFGIQSTTGVGAWKSFYELFKKAKIDNVYDKVYLMPITHNFPNRRKKVLVALAETTGISYEEVYYKYRYFEAYYDIDPADFARSGLILINDEEIAETGHKAEEIYADMSGILSEHWIDKDDYFSNRLYETAETERGELIDKIERDKICSAVVSETEVDYDGVASQLDNAKEKYGVNGYNYMRYKMYNVPEEEWQGVIEKYQLA